MRTHNWLSSLETHINSNKKTSFAWGTHDCCTFAADSVLKSTGVDLMAHFRGKYNDAEGAQLMLKDLTGTPNATVEDAMDVLTTVHEFLVKLGVSFAQRGDVVSLLKDKQLTLGVVGMNGQHAWFTGDLLVKVPVSMCSRAWGVR